LPEAPAVGEGAVQRRQFLHLVSTVAVAALMPRSALAATPARTPNIIIVLCDQWSFGTSKASGFPLDTTPTLDRLGAGGFSFDRNYCTAPLCVPSRISMLTGRWPEAHRVRMNLQANDAFFDKDLYQVAKARGYRTALIGKNHTYLTEKDVDVWREYFHEGASAALKPSPQDAAYDQWLRDLHFNISDKPTPFPLTSQLPYRIMTDALAFVDAAANQPFLLQISIPEPHDPEQVPEPYWDMFPPASIPGRYAGPEGLPLAGERLQWEYRMQQDAFPDTEKWWRRYLSNYCGMLRLIDDQIARLERHLKDRGIDNDTLVVFTSDHGDSLMNFGIGHKGLGLHESVVHTPMLWWGAGIRPNKEAANAFTSMADLMPTLCEAMTAAIPNGVQGRSLWPLLQGQAFPKEEFQSIYSGVGVGGLYYEKADAVPLAAGHRPKLPDMFDELNKVTLSGNQKMVRMGAWKLVYDMMGYGQLYNLERDPGELTNQFGKKRYAAIQADLMAELAMWTIRIQDALPTGPQNSQYQTKWPGAHNWYAPYRRTAKRAGPYVP
jgi:arylsulfatase A-like enzyme